MKGWDPKATSAIGHGFQGHQSYGMRLEGHQGYRDGVPWAAGEGWLGAGAVELGFL